jgi:hypothetical protein
MNHSTISFVLSGFILFYFIFGVDWERSFGRSSKLFGADLVDNGN